MTGARTRSFIPRSLTDLALGDFNGDGKLDLALADALGTVDIVTNGGGTFNFTAMRLYPRGATVTGLVNAGGPGSVSGSPG